MLSSQKNISPTAAERNPSQLGQDGRNLRTTGGRGTLSNQHSDANHQTTHGSWQRRTAKYGSGTSSGFESDGVKEDDLYELRKIKTVEKNIGKCINVEKTLDCPIDKVY